MPDKTNGKPRSKLYLRTLQLLRDRPTSKTLKMIADETRLPYFWLCSLSRPHISPCVDRIEQLYEYLSKKSLNV